MKQEPKKKIT